MPISTNLRFGPTVEQKAKSPKKIQVTALIQKKLKQTITVETLAIGQQSKVTLA